MPNSTPTPEVPAQELSTREYARLITFYLRPNAVDSKYTLAKFLRMKVISVSATALATEIGCDVESVRQWENCINKPKGQYAVEYLAWLDHMWKVTQPLRDGELTGEVTAA